MKLPSPDKSVLTTDDGRLSWVYTWSEPADGGGRGTAYAVEGQNGREWTSGHANDARAIGSA